MTKVKYHLNGGWIAPAISMMLDSSGYEQAISDVTECQKLLGEDLSKLDMATNEGHAALCNACLVSSQLRLYKNNAEDLLSYHVDPVPGQAMIVTSDEAVKLKNRGDKSASTRNFRGAR